MPKPSPEARSDGLSGVQLALRRRRRRSARATARRWSKTRRRAQADLVGQILADRYRVVRLIGEGGMGQVYEAQHVNINKRFAIKLLRPEIVSNAEAVARFRQEAWSASSIGHENIIEIEDFATLPSGAVYLAMEFLDGVALAERMRRSRRCRSRESLDIVLQVRRGLAAAHDKGIVHRDMKPENIFLGAEVRPPAGEDPRLRHRQGVGRRRQQLADAHRHDLRNAALHVAGAGARQAARSPRRHLLGRRDHVRAVHRQGAVRSRDLHGHPDQAHHDAADAAAAGGARARDPRRDRGGDHARPGQGGRRALPVDGRAVGGAGRDRERAGAGGAACRGRRRRRWRRFPSRCRR